jgi:hypothetical protein
VLKQIDGVDASNPALQSQVYDAMYGTFGRDAPSITKFVMETLANRALHPGQSMAEMLAGWYAFFSHQPKEDVDIYPGGHPRGFYGLTELGSSIHPVQFTSACVLPETFGGMQSVDTAACAVSLLPRASLPSCGQSRIVAQASTIKTPTTCCAGC